MRIIRLHKRPTPDLGTAERCVKRLPESSTGTGNAGLALPASPSGSVPDRKSRCWNWPEPDPRIYCSHSIDASWDCTRVTGYAEVIRRRTLDRFGGFRSNET